jgi:two-component system osmolarity sensor histidine kinase EnvZ
MNAFLFHKNTFYRRIFITIIALLIISQIITIIAVLSLVLLPGSDSFAHLSLALLNTIDIVLQQNNPELLNSVISRVKDVSGIQWIRNPDLSAQFDTINRLRQPGISQAAKTIDELSAGRAHLFTQESSKSIVWLYHAAEPHFAIGMPLGFQLWLEQYTKMALCLTFLLSLTTGWLLASRLSKPLHRLTRDAICMETDKNFNLITSPGDPIEVIQLTGALNQMKAGIDSLVKKREEYLAGISHDLRTPLTRLRVTVELLPESALVSDMRQDIDEMCVGLEQTVELTRLDIEANELWQQGNVDLFITALVAKYQRISEDVVFLPGDVGMINFKPIALTRLLYNLIDNALKHGKGRVIICSSLAHQRPEIQISTEGSYHSDSSDLFTRLWTTSGGQSGLGNKIICRMSEVHGAQIKFDTDQQGQLSYRLTFNEQIESALPPASTR